MRYVAGSTLDRVLQADLVLAHAHGARAALHQAPLDKEVGEEVRLRTPAPTKRAFVARGHKEGLEDLCRTKTERVSHSSNV